MSERKTWTLQEDQALKLLKEQRKIKKWSKISELLAIQFGIGARNGKQCRQRKSIRVVNEQFRQYFKKSVRPLRTTLIKEIVDIIEYNLKNSQKVVSDLYLCAQSLKQKLLEYSMQLKQTDIDVAKLNLTNLVEDANRFNKLKKKDKSNNKDKRIKVISDKLAIQQGVDQYFSKQPSLKKMKTKVQKLSSSENQDNYNESLGQLDGINEDSQQLVNQLDHREYKLIDYTDVKIEYKKCYFGLDDLSGVHLQLEI